MNNKITMAQVEERLQENKMAYYPVALGNGHQIFITKHGGRVIGPFDRDTGESLIWLCKPFESKERFKEGLSNGRFPLGGERLWIAPELNFYTTERMKFDETYHCQPEIDPGNYSVVQAGNGVKLQMLVDAKVYELPFSSKQFGVTRFIQPAANPLLFTDDFEDLMKGVDYAGYRQEVGMEDLSPEKVMYLEPWLVMQLNPGGEVIIPYTGRFTFDDYYEPIDETIQSVREGYAVLQGTGKRKYKVGYKAAKTTGRSAYFIKLDEERHLLVIKSFYNDPSTPYCMEGWKKPGIRGCSLYIYNDNGLREGFGGFVEFEHCGLTIGRDSGRTQSSSETCHYFFIGKKERLLRIADELLGVLIES
jgi:hypothetical protein